MIPVVLAAVVKEVEPRASWGTVALERKPHGIWEGVAAVPDSWMDSTRTSTMDGSMEGSNELMLSARGTVEACSPSPLPAGLRSI